MDDAASPDPFGAYPQTFQATGMLLKATDPVALCLMCHDNMAGTPDVVGADVNGLVERSAGHFATPGTANPRGHRLDYGLETDDYELCMRCHFGGTFATASVTCIDCHNPHGNGRPRNLQWASWPGGEPQFGLLVNPGVTGVAKYEAANVAYGTLNSDDLREVTNMCIDCHHVFSGDTYTNPDGSGIHSLHPTYDSERDARNTISQGEGEGTTDPGHWTDGAGAGYQLTARLRFVQDGGTDYASCTQVDPATNGVFCLSCHKAHGGYRAYGLTWSPPVVSGINGEGCDQCHDKANE
jgi:cytochrome c2